MYSIDTEYQPRRRAVGPNWGAESCNFLTNSSFIKEPLNPAASIPILQNIRVECFDKYCDNEKLRTI